MACPINAVLLEGPAFVSLSPRDQMVCLAELLKEGSALSSVTPAWNYSAISEREQWIAIATLMDECASAASDTNPNTLLSGAKDFQGASKAAGIAAINQRVCDFI